MAASQEVRFRAKILAWSSSNSRSFPWRDTTDAYKVLIGEVLLQRTRGEHVVEVYEHFVARWPTPDKLARARASSIAAVIRPLGLSKRAPLLNRLGRELAALGRVPTTPEELEALPGVGPYAANAARIFAAGEDLPLVDWVIARVLRRYFGLESSRRPNADAELWNLATRLAVGGKARDLWLGTLDLAAAVCRPTPRCPECPLSGGCAFFKQADRPMSPAHRKITAV